MNVLIFFFQRTLEADGYTAYTCIRLGPAFGVFIGLILLQMLVMFFVKKNMSPRFRASKWPTMLKHLFESVNRPDYFVDWDRDGGNVAEHGRRWQIVLVETSAMVCIHFVFNLLLLVPLWVTSRTTFSLFWGVGAVYRDHLLIFSNTCSRETLDHQTGDWGFPRRD